jgi:hypothetical protein
MKCKRLIICATNAARTFGKKRQLSLVVALNPGVTMKRFVINAMTKIKINAPTPCPSCVKEIMHYLFYLGNGKIPELCSECNSTFAHSVIEQTIKQLERKNASH